MMVMITKSFGSWYSGEERDLQDAVAQRLIDEGRAKRIENKKLKTLDEVCQQKAELELIRRTEEISAQELKEEKAVALRKKRAGGND